jgi:hypothetical protein
MMQAVGLQLKCLDGFIKCIYTQLASCFCNLHFFKAEQTRKCKKKHLHTSWNVIILNVFGCITSCFGVSDY